MRLFAASTERSVAVRAAYTGPRPSHKRYRLLSN
jgi:hypothetical protein